VKARARRGRDSERLVAEHLRARGIAGASAVDAYTPGADVTAPGLAIEVKARRGLDLGAWMKQAHRQGRGAYPLLVVRLAGQGPADVGAWIACTPLDSFLDLWET